MIPAPLLPYIDFLLGAVFFLALCRREPVRVTEPIQDDGWTKIEIHYG